MRGKAAFSSSWFWAHINIFSKLGSFGSDEKKEKNNIKQILGR